MNSNGLGNAKGSYSFMDGVSMNAFEKRTISDQGKQT